jgi:drug/metabolite transporter (DMT)-like permease
MAVTALALGSALAWGTADFIGGVKTRTLPVTAVAVSSQLAGAGILTVLIAVASPAGPSGRTLLFGVLAGAANTIGLVAFYRGLAIGRMSVVAPIAGLGVVVPVTVGLASGERPSAVQGAGMLVAILGVALSTRQREAGPACNLGRSVLLAVIAALGIGGNLALLEQGVHHASADAVLWAVLCSRLAAALILSVPLLARARCALPRAGDVPALVLLGATDLLANLLYGLAVRNSLLSLAAVLASLHPAVTVVLARLLLSERMRGTQQLGVALAIAGACLLSAG